MFIVIYYESYVGYHFDEKTRYFTSWTAAFNYSQKLNLELAEANNCEVEYLGDYYTIEEIEKGE